MKINYVQFFTAFILSALLFIIAMPVHAYQYQSPLSIKKAVSQFLELQTDSNHFTVSNIDKRLRLKLCSKTLKTRFPQYSEQLGRTSVEVSCDGVKPWKFLVSVYIKKITNILTAKHALPAGSILTENDISIKRVDISRIRNGHFKNINEIKNMVVRRAIRAGKVISPGMLKPKQLVNRGDEVLILAQTNNLQIKVKGKALMNGFLGQRIKVKNMNSRRIFQATVISNGLVKVNM